MPRLCSRKRPSTSPRRTDTLHGWYHDPLHGHGLRRVRRIRPHLYEIVGVYGDDEPYTHRPWIAMMTLLEDGKYSVDFAGKPTKTKHKTMTVLYKNRKLHWIEDGNVWDQLYVHPRQLR